MTRSHSQLPICPPASEESPDRVANIAIVEDDINNRREWVKALNQRPEYRVIGEFGTPAAFSRPVWRWDLISEQWQG